MTETYVGLSGLKDAITAATNSQISGSLVHSEVMAAYEAAGDVGLRQLAAQYGINYVPQKLAYGYTLDGWSITGEATASGLSPFMQQSLYQNVLETSVNTTTNQLTYQTARQVATQAGTKTFLKGATKTMTKALPVIGAIATGVDLGWESYKAHPDFWTDLSESIFDTDDPNTPVEVLARAHEGGYTTAFKEQEMCNILQKMAAQGCFDYREYESNIDHTGIQDVTWSSVGAAGNASALAMNKASELYPGTTCIQVVEVQASPTIVQGIAYVQDSASLPDRANVSSFTESGVTYYYAPLSCYSVLAQVDTTSGTVTYTDRGYDSDYIRSGLVPSTNQKTIGGLSVDLVEYEATNELFTNDHSGTALSIAPTSTLDQIAQAIKNQFPDWYGDSFTMDEYDPTTDTVNTNRYYPLTIPWWDSVENPLKDPNFDPDAARDGEILPDSDPNAQTQGKEATSNNYKYDTDVDYQYPVPNPAPDPTPSDPGAGTGGTSDALWCVYNPTLGELNDLGSYLWSSNIIDILQKFLQNPMDAVISLHKIYCVPETYGRQNIALGYLDSGVPAAVVTNQFVTIDCGSVAVPEYFNDARDYDEPYTVIEAYLPFIGIVRWKTADIIGGTVQIVYTIDVYSGACLCKVFVTKLGTKLQLYTYSGNCSMQIPLTGSDRTRLLSGAVTGATAGAVAGGPLGAVAGAVAGAWKGGTSIDRTCSFSANAGCMGIKKPYILITRKYSYDAGNYNQYYGYPTNNTLTLSACHGYTRVKSVHIDSISRATDNEKAEIETLLKQGIIIK